MKLERLHWSTLYQQVTLERRLGNARNSRAKDIDQNILSARKTICELIGKSEDQASVHGTGCHGVQISRYSIFKLCSLGRVYTKYTKCEQL
jgi:hypothetical protein